MLSNCCISLTRSSVKTSSNFPTPISFYFSTGLSKLTEISNWSFWRKVWEEWNFQRLGVFFLQRKEIWHLQKIYSYFQWCQFSFLFFVCHWRCWAAVTEWHSSIKHMTVVPRDVLIYQLCMYFVAFIVLSSPKDARTRVAAQRKWFSLCGWMFYGCLCFMPVNWSRTAWVKHRQSRKCAS